jgi:hypothetical protein
MRPVAKTLVRGLLAVLCMLLPAIAFAQTLNPAGYSGWNLFVYGNGDVIAEILENIRRMIAPDYGGGSFRALLLFFALGGFAFIVVQAAVDPARHMLRLATYVFLVWMVVTVAARMDANVIVVDKLTGRTYVVQKAPAIVALPASIASEFGYWMTRQIETNYSYPDLTLSQAPGGYSLLPRMLDDARKFTVTDPELRRTLGAYATDCVVPAVARGSMSASELATAPNLLEALRKAQHNAIMTVYYKNGAVAGTTPDCGGASVGTFEGNLGAVVSCAAAYECLRRDVIEHAQALLDAEASQWESTGVLLPYEQAMNTALQFTGAPGNVAFAGRSRSHGFILQRAMTDTLRGSFRTAAMQTGNNELLSAVAVRQAEQMQRSTWWTASELFKTLMPYIYTVLQIFIFAIAPVIVVTLLIPGLGLSIVKNYAQILVWLTLWMPLLAIVNFIILAIAKNDLGALMGAGVNMTNQYVVDEKTNNLLMAANYLGTLVPLITWGLVKGTLAFTEFIQAGIGSSFATQAGSTASTGNLSLGNMSMDNVSANKYSIATASEIGDKGVTAYLGAGSLLSKVEGGGASAKFNDVAAQRNMQESLQHALNANMSKGLQERFSQDKVFNELRQRGLDTSLAKQLSEDFKRDVIDRLSNRTFSSEEHARSEAARLTKEWSEKAEAQHAANARQSTTAAVGVRADMGLNILGSGMGVSARAETSGTNEQATMFADKLDTGRGGQNAIEGSHRKTGGTDASQEKGTTTSHGQGEGLSQTTTVTNQQLRSALESFGNAVSSEVGTLYQESYQKASSMTSSVGMALTGSEAMGMYNSAMALGSQVSGGLAAAQNKVEDGRRAAAGAHGAAAERNAQWNKKLDAKGAELKGSFRPQGPTPPVIKPNPGEVKEQVKLVQDAENFGQKGANAGLKPYRDMSNNPTWGLGQQMPMHNRS